MPFTNACTLIIVYVCPSEVPRQFLLGGGGALRKKVTNFTSLTDYFSSIENILTMKEIIVYTLNYHKVRANDGMKV